MAPSIPIFLLTGGWECKQLFDVALPSTIRSLSWNSLRTSSCCCIQNLSIEGTRYVLWIRWNVEELKSGSFNNWQSGHFLEVVAWNIYYWFSNNFDHFWWALKKRILVLPRPAVCFVTVIGTIVFTVLSMRSINTS